MSDLNVAHATPRSNRLLGALSSVDLAAVVPALEPVSLDFKDVLSGDDGVYFPLRGVFSVMRRVDDGSVVEIARVGREGMVGVPAFLGAAGLGDRELAMVQVPGPALRMSHEHFGEVVRPQGPLHGPIQRYICEFLSVVAQQAVCNRLHSVEERCSRWLLFTHDHMGVDEFPVTHDFLSEMLHIRRSSVTKAAGILQNAQLIRYRRGHVTVVDRQGLERTACECYRLTRSNLATPPN